MTEFEQIVEFSFIEKQKKFVIRFLDGSSYVLSTKSLPKKMQTKKPAWENAYLSKNKTSIIVHANKEIREIPAYLIHSKGTSL